MEQPINQTGLRAAYSPEGYIVDQARITDVPYGCRPSSQNGCGWIGVFNLLKALGTPVPYQEVVEALAKRSLFRGRFGTSPWRIHRYLKKQGWAMRWALGKKRAIAASERADAGILIYRHSGGWHFVAFQRRESGLFRFYNAVAGAYEHDRTMEDFLKEQNRAKIVWLMYREELSPERID